MSFWGSGEIWRFSLCVGIGGGLIWDIWALHMRLMGVVVLDWSMVGRAVIGRFHGHSSLCESCHAVSGRRKPHSGTGNAVRYDCLISECGVRSYPNLAERLTGWGLHYGYCIFYALMIPLLWGRDFSAHPVLWPFLVITLGVKTYTGYVIASPAMGYGMFIRRHYHPMLVLGLIAVGHGFAAVGEYGIALGLTHL